MDAPDESIILLNYNSSVFTLSCIQSIINQTATVRYEIIVVDNGSSPEEYDALQSVTRYPFIKLVRNRVNGGFSAGNMTGVQVAAANTRYYYFLNNDCLLLNDVCDQLVKFMDQAPDAGICTAQMLSASLEPKLSFQYFPTAAVKLLGHGFMRFCHPGQYPPLRGSYTKPVQVPLVMGSSLFVRPCAFHQIGGFDTAYFLYCEEEDICKRLLLQGYRAYLVPQASYIHLGGKKHEPYARRRKGILHLAISLLPQIPRLARADGVAVVLLPEKCAQVLPERQLHAAGHFYPDR